MNENLKYARQSGRDFARFLREVLTIAWESNNNMGRSRKSQKSRH